MYIIGGKVLSTEPVPSQFKDLNFSKGGQSEHFNFFQSQRGGQSWTLNVFFKLVTYRPTLSKFRGGPVKKNTLYVLWSNTTRVGSCILVFTIPFALNSINGHFGCVFWLPRVPIPYTAGSLISYSQVIVSFTYSGLYAVGCFVKTLFQPKNKAAPLRGIYNPDPKAFFVWTSLGGHTT